jgi:hypothetical protein
MEAETKLKEAEIVMELIVISGIGVFVLLAASAPISRN